MSTVIADKFCHSSKHKLFLSRLDYCPSLTRLLVDIAFLMTGSGLAGQRYLFFYKTIPSENGRQSLRNGHGACPKWVTCLPRLGTICTHFVDI